jgi:hypothetical protein
MAAEKPLDVEIVAHITGSMQHCSHCQVFIDGVGVGEKIHRENISSYPPEFIADWQRLSDWILEVARDYPGQLVIRVTDAQSPQGLWKALTKGVRKYPTFIIDGQEKYHGWDKDQLNNLILKHL